MLLESSAGFDSVNSGNSPNLTKPKLETDMELRVKKRAKGVTTVHSPNQKGKMPIF
jgi:hypothetical protein